MTKRELLMAALAGCEVILHLGALWVQAAGYRFAPAPLPGS